MSDQDNGRPQDPNDPTQDRPALSAQPEDNPQRPAPFPRTPERPGPYQGVFGSSGQQPPPPQYGQSPAGDRPGPYQGAFGQPGGGPGAPRPTSWAQRPNPYAYQPNQSPPPKQVTIASAISLGLGGLCVLLGLFSLTAAGEEIAELLTGSPDRQGVVVAAILVTSVLYILPAIFVRKRRRWARVMLIVVAAIGIAGGVGALPGSLIGLGLHAAVLILMLQQPTKLWFQHR